MIRLGLELMKNDLSDSTQCGWIVKANKENPYSDSGLQMVDPTKNTDKKIDSILSIPSPYARLHVTESAFLDGAKREFKELPPVYRRSISHCLDVFEMFYKFDGINLLDRDITIQNYKYQYDDELQNDGAKLLVSTLELYRDNYGKDKFVNFYVVYKTSGGVKYPIAVTSPFTIFSTPEDINAACELNVDNTNILFSQDSSKWRGIEDRPEVVQQFIWSILNYDPNSNQYNLFYDYLKNRIASTIQSSTGSFKTTYRNFTVQDSGIPIKVDAHFDKDIQLLPLGYDTFVFENFLNTSNAHDYSIVEDPSSEYYNLKITDRKNIFTGEDNPAPLYWITIHDLLENDVFVTTKAIDDDKYLAVADNEDSSHVVLPLKKKFFELFNFFDVSGGLISKDDVSKWIKVRFVGEQDAFDESMERKIYVTLTLPVKSSDHDHYVNVTKVYDTSHIHSLDIDFGIYPFVQAVPDPKQEGAPCPDNFYRVMLYLSNNKLDNANTDFMVYAKDDNGLLRAKPLANETGCYNIQRKNNTLQTYYESIPDNLYYLSLESKYMYKGSISSSKDVRFNFVEVIVDKKSFLMVPRLNVCQLTNPAASVLAVDLGTTNTYVACGQNSGVNNVDGCKQFADNNGILVGKFCVDKGNPLSHYDWMQGGLHQFSEFIPSEFGDGENKGNFPVHSLMMFQPNVVDKDRLNNTDYSNSEGEPLVSLFSMDIPFLYDHKGYRVINDTPIDRIASNFKWFTSKNGEQFRKNAYILFVDQLCFMLRNRCVKNMEKLENVKLIWTYPLSMVGSGEQSISSIWNNAYQKYFNGSQLIRLTESETPVATISASSTSGYKMGIDIGGGTTDVILYRKQLNQNMPILASSFAFAGNTLFGCIRDNSDIKNGENLWFQTLQPVITPQSLGSESSLKTKTIDLKADAYNITEVMDHVFSHDMKINQAKIMDTLRNSSNIKFVNLLHSTAILWEVALISKAKLQDKDDYPKHIVFSGNGSKLMFLSLPDRMVGNDDIDRQSAIKLVVTEVFKYVYDNENIKIDSEILSNPKRATAQGAIIMVNNGINGTQVTGKSFVHYLDKLYQTDGSIANSDMDKGKTNSAGNLLGTVIRKTNTDNPNERIDPSYANTGKIVIGQILNDWELWADKVGDFLDFFFQIATGELGGNMYNSVKIKEQVLGYNPEQGYRTSKMKSLIKEAQNAIMDRASTSEDSSSVSSMPVNESVFLSIIAQILGEMLVVLPKL